MISIPPVFSCLKCGLSYSSYIDGWFFRFNKELCYASQRHRIIGTICWCGIILGYYLTVLRCKSFFISNVPTKELQQRVNILDAARMLIIIVSRIFVKSKVYFEAIQ